MDKKIFLAGGLFLAIVVLGGCGLANDDSKKMEVQVPSAPQENETPKTKEAEKSALPESVSTKPGATVDDEIKNIDNDLNSIDDASLTAGMSDDELGL